MTLELVTADYNNVGFGRWTDQPLESTKKRWDRITTDFTKRNPNIRVHVKVYTFAEINEKAAEMVKLGKAPDMLETNAYAGFAADNMLYSADELLGGSTKADFITSLTRAGEVGHVQYGLPFVSSTRLLFYNTDLFRKAGIKAPPKNWSEVEKDAAKLKANGVDVPFGMPLGGSEPAESMIWMLGNGGGFTDAFGTYAIDSPRNVATFRWMKDHLVNRGLAGPAPATTARQDVFEGFVKGKVGMLNGHPGLLGEADKAGIKYGVASIPGKNGPLKGTLGVADWMMAFKKNGHRDEIKKFLEFLYTKKNTLALLKGYNLMPVTVSASDAMRADRDLKDLWLFLDKLPTAEFYPLGDPSWTPIVEEIKKNIGKAVTGDPESELGKLQRYAEKTTSQAES